jgi:GT2 family glycosyltransferase
VRVAAVVPNWNGRRWLDGCLRSVAPQFDEVLVVDNGSTDDSAGWLAQQWPDVRVIALGANRGFAAAANAGLRATGCEAVALVNTDVELAGDWRTRTEAALADGVASVATKMVSLRDSSILDDCGDVLRRDGVCEQRGRGRRDDGRWDAPGEVFSACAGAALYRRDAVLAVGGFDERLFSYLEDVDLGLRLRLAGWRCAYEPVVARHWGGGSAGQLEQPVTHWVERNTLLVCARAFPLRWLAGPFAYRQLAWLVVAARERRLRAFFSGVRAALPLLRTFRGETLPARVAVEEVVPARPFRGPAAGGHPEAGF